MNATYEVRQGYLYVNHTGEFDEADAQRICVEWLALARREGLTRILCDLSLVKGLGNELELTMNHYRIASFIADLLPKNFRLATLQDPGQIAKDRFGENVMRNKGACAKMTSSLEEALEWLDLPQPSQVQTTTSYCH